ncbi:MAG: glycoside hydrolase family 57 protein [Akkermansia sp.]
MSKICLNFIAHQPNRLIPYDFFKIGEHAFYEDDDLNGRVLNAVAERCYLPANRMMKQLIELTEGQFRFGLAISGVLLEQACYHRPDLIVSFRELADTGCVDFILMPYYCSLASVYSPSEFAEQVEEHAKMIKKLFGKKASVLVNTGMLYSNSTASQVETLGLKGIIADGNPALLQGYKDNEVFLAPQVSKTSTIFRNKLLSNDLAFKRTDPEWEEYPLSPLTFVDWLSNQTGSVTTISMDYETLGERQNDASGVFEFWKTLITNALERDNQFLTPTEVTEKIKPVGVCDCTQDMTSSAFGSMEQWNGNVMQDEAIKKIYRLEGAVKAANNTDLTHVWRKLQSADHFQYMEKDNSFMPYASPYDAYIYYMNALSDLQIRVKRIAALNKATPGQALV